MHEDTEKSKEIARLQELEKNNTGTLKALVQDKKNLKSDLYTLHIAPPIGELAKFKTTTRLFPDKLPVSRSFRFPLESGHRGVWQTKSI